MHVDNFIFGATMARTKTTKAKPPVDILQYVYAQATKVHDALINAGIPEPAASYATFQIYHETAAFNDAKYKLHNNGAGIKFAGQKGATRGANNYAYFDTLSDFIRSFAHELKKGANPAGASFLEDYAARLKKNNYYEDTLDNYIAGFGLDNYEHTLTGLKRARYVLKSLPATQRASTQPDGSVQDRQDLDIPGSTDYSKTGFLEWWNGLQWWGKGLAIAVPTVAVIIIAKK